MAGYTQPLSEMMLHTVYILWSQVLSNEDFHCPAVARGQGNPLGVSSSRQLSFEPKRWFTSTRCSGSRSTLWETPQTRTTWCRTRCSARIGPGIKFARGTNAKAWLITILRHVFIDAYHREAPPPADSELRPPPSDDARVPFFDDLVDDQVVHAIDALPRPMGVIVLRDIEDLHYGENGDHARRSGGDREVAPVPERADPAREAARLRVSTGLIKR